MGTSTESNHQPTMEDPFEIQRELLEAPRPLAGRPSNIVAFYQNRSVLITGASGFIGKVLIEKLVRTCPLIRRIFVLIRPKWNKQPEARLKELLQAPLFDGVRNESDLEQRVVLVEGDVTQPNLGLSRQNLLRIMNEVSVIFHSAATVKFDEPLKQSIGINIAGTKNMIDVCRRIPQLAALVHISTAYANCQLDEIDEHVYPVDMDPERLIKMADWLDQDTLQELKRRLLGSRPNTYTYTKALAEWLLVKSARDLPVVVCRPSIVVASWREPFSGWIDNVNGPTGIILGAGKGLIRSMFAERSYVADLVPVDTVINLIVSLGWFAHVYKNQKQLNDAAESLTESLIGSGSSSSSAAPSSLADADSFDDRIRQLSPIPLDQSLDRADEQMTIDDDQEGRDRHQNGNHNDSNNNNNNNSSFHHHNDLYPTQTNHQLDDGYGSSRSPDCAHSLVSSSSSTHRRHPKLSSIHPDKPSAGKMTIGLDGVNMGSENHSSIDLIEQQRLNEEKQADFEYKLKQFRHNTRAKLMAKNLPEDLADIPVFHCTSGGENPITWGRVQILVLTILALFPSITTYRYPCGSFTNKKRLDDFYRITLHYIPGYVVDFITKICGGKPVIVKIFKKFDQAASVLKAFTSKQWKFSYDNRLMLMNELMTDEDRRLFNCDIKSLDWEQFCRGYVLGVRKFMLKEPMSNLNRARTNLKIVYYRNLSLQMLLFAAIVYYFSTFSIVRWMKNLIY